MQMCQTRVLSLFTLVLNGEDHIRKKYDALALMDINTLSVIIMLLMKISKGEVTRWYHFLFYHIIIDWITMVVEFKKHFQGEDDVVFLLGEFNTILIHDDEPILFQTMLYCHPR